MQMSFKPLEYRCRSSSTSLDRRGHPYTTQSSYELDNTRHVKGSGALTLWSELLIKTLLTLDALSGVWCV